MEHNDQEFKKSLDKLAKDASFILANPKTLEKLRSRGLPIQSKFVTYREYLDKLFEEKKKIAQEIMGDFPPLSGKVANAAVKSLYEETRECYALGLFGAAIVLGSILLELSFKYKVYNRRKEQDANVSWSSVESLNFTSTIKKLRRLDEISESEKIELLKFNKEIRNPHVHYNLQKLVKNIMVSELPMINTETGKVTILKDVEIAKNPHLWFSSKRFLDKNQAHPTLEFCVSWVNKILT